MTPPTSGVTSTNRPYESATQPIVALVCGSRTLRKKDYAHVLKRIAELPAGSTVIHGDARGVDRVAGALAEAFGLKVIACPAKWNVHGRAAGPIRNREMLDLEPHVVLAFWDGVSSGTKDTIDEGGRRGIPVEVLP